MMKTIRYHRSGDFLQAVGPFLEKQPVANQLLLANALRLQASEVQTKVLMAGGFVEDSPVLAAIMIPPHYLVLSYDNVESSDACEAAKQLAECLAPFEIPGVIGRQELAAPFSAGYCGRRKIRCRWTESLGIHKLTRVVPPEQSRGYLRVAVHADLPVVLAWYEAFGKDTGHNQSPEEVHDMARREVTAGSIYLWEHDQPVSTAASKRPLGKGIAIGAVYTPPEFRRRGYASACVAALSQLLLDSGYEYCSLFTNLANPTSNHIYRAIGYEPVGEVETIQFLH